MAMKPGFQNGNSQETLEHGTQVLQQTRNAKGKSQWKKASTTESTRRQQRENLWRPNEA